jgi:hypothetical protein
VRLFHQRPRRIHWSLQGQQVFNARCATCHALVPDTIIIGPSLAGVATRAETRVDGQTAEEYLQLSVLRPGDYVVEGFTNIMITNFSQRNLPTKI